MDKEQDNHKRDNHSENDEEGIDYNLEFDDFDDPHPRNPETKNQKPLEDKQKSQDKRPKKDSSKDKKNDNYSSKPQEKSSKDKESIRRKEEEFKKKEEESQKRAEKMNRDIKSFYHEFDESEFSVHFYIGNVYLSPNRSIPEFLQSIKERIKKAGQSEYVQIAHYEVNEVKLSVGMKYDQDAIDILNHKRTIYLYNKDQKLYETKPVISKAFEIYCEYKKKGIDKKSEKETGTRKFERKKSAGSSNSKSHASHSKKRKNSTKSSKSKSRSISRKKDYEKSHPNYFNKSNFEKNLIKPVEKSKTGRRSTSVKNRDDSNINRKNFQKSFRDKSPVNKSRKTRNSLSKSVSRNEKYHKHSESRSRSRNRSYEKYKEKKISKETNLEKEKPKNFSSSNAPIDVNANNFSRSQTQQAFNQSGNMPIVDNNSTNLINMAYLMNQQLVQNTQSYQNNSLDNKLGINSMNEFLVQYANNPTFNIPPGIQQQQTNIISTTVNPEKKESLAIQSQDLNNNLNSENNIEANNLPPVNNASTTKSSGKNFTITNNDNKKIISFTHRKQQKEVPVVQTISNLPNQDINDRICLLLGIPQQYDINDVVSAIKQMNSDIEKTVKSTEELIQYSIDLPSEFYWEKNLDMDYLKIVFSNMKSAENLIVNSLKINQNSVIVLPYLLDKPLIDLLEFHEMKVHTIPKVDEFFIYHNFSIYGDIVNIVDESNSSSESSFIIIYAHSLSVKRVNLPLNCQIPLENNEIINVLIQKVEKPVTVKRPQLLETMNSKFSINSIYQSYQKNEQKIITTSKNASSLQTGNENSSNTQHKETSRIIKKDSLDRNKEKNDSPAENRNDDNYKGYKNNSRNDISESPPHKYNKNNNYNRNNGQNYRYNNNNSNYRHNNNYSRENYNSDYRSGGGQTRRYNNNNNNNSNPNANANRDYSNNKYGNSREKYYDNNRNYSQNKRNSNY